VSVCAPVVVAPVGNVEDMEVVEKESCQVDEEVDGDDEDYDEHDE